MVKSIHDNIDFSLSVKKIPSETFLTNFRKKYDIEFNRLASLSNDGFNLHLDNNHHSEKYNNGHSSAHSSVYSQNLGRNISVASSNNDNSILRQIEVNKLSAVNQETTSSTQVLNSQNTHAEPIKAVPLFGGDVFARGTHHINHFDNSIIEKLPKVEYEIEIGSYGIDDSTAADNHDDEIMGVEEEKNEESECMMLGPQQMTYDNSTRPLKTLDQAFERLTAKRLASFMCHYIEQTQYDAYQLQKQLDLTIVNVKLVEGEASMKQ